MTTNDRVVSFPAARSNPVGRRLIPERLKAARIAKGLNQTDLAQLLGVTRQAVSAWETGEKAPDVDKTLKLASMLDQRPSYFVTPDRPGFGKYSARFLRAFGSKTIRRNLMCNVLGDWFVQTVKYLDGYVNFPKLTLPDAHSNSHDGRYADEAIEHWADECRRTWGLGAGPISNVISLLENKGIHVCRVEMEDENIEAFSYWNGDRTFIFLSSDKESAVRARFDAAHELGHLVLHRSVDPNELEQDETLRQVEREANHFAGAFLMPKTSFPNEVFTTRLDAFLDLKQRWKVAIQAMIYRCRDLDVIDEDQFTNLYKQISKRKWRKKEPLDDRLPLEQPRMLKQALEVLVTGGVKHPDTLLAEISLSPQILSRILNVNQSLFQSEKPPDYTPTLK